MGQPQSSFLLAISLSCLVAASLPPCTLGSGGGKPLVTPITKDASTSLYTAPLKDSRPLLLDLSGPLIWSTCDAGRPTLQPGERECTEASRHTRPDCWAYSDSNGGGNYYAGGQCTARPSNPVTGRCASGDLTRATLSANATDGRNPLYPVSFPAVASCAPPSLLDKLPPGAAGVAGLARSELALHAQVASAQGVAGTFALCLPSGGEGVAIFGGGPLFLLPPWLLAITSIMKNTTLRRFQDSPGYYIWIKSIDVSQTPVPLPAGYQHAPLVVGFSTTAPYTALRPDVYRPFVQAFGDAASGFDMPRLAPVAPFELCYNSSALGSFRGGYVVPQIDLVLEDGNRYGVFGANSMVRVADATACLAFVEMDDPERLGYSKYAPAPAVVVGGYQMENNLLVFDGEKQQLGLSSLLLFRQTTCSNFNFTMAA